MSARKTFTLAVAMACLFSPAAWAQDSLQHPSATTTVHSLSVPADRLQFDIASVRPDKSDESDIQPFMNIDPTLSDGPVAPGGFYLARNIKMIQFIAFAYKLTLIQLQSVVSQVPWTNEDRFDIEARAGGNPTKDQYRKMMQSLLADRFKLTVHYETQIVPVYALTLAIPGRYGPQLRLHHADDPFCAVKPTQSSSSPSGRPKYQFDADGYPEVCGGLLSLPPSSPGRMKSGGRDVAMSMFADVITGVGRVDRPLVDKTAIQGSIDYVLEWARSPEQTPSGKPFEPDDSALPFRGALKAQLGINMVSEKDPVQVFLVDHIEHPTPN